MTKTAQEFTDPTSARPDYVTQEHLDYLDALRDSGTINMFGATDDVIAEFSLDKRTARQVLNYWMGSFGNPDR